MRGLRILASLVLLVVLGSTAWAAGLDDGRLERLFAQLKQASSADEARPLEAAIWTLWTISGKPEIDSLMGRGIAALQAGDLDEALRTFDSMVTAAPTFAEAWNKRATVYYLLGDYDASVADIEKTLQLEPRHFGALSGLGMIYLALGKDDAALKVFERALSVDPFLPGAATAIEAIRRKKDGSPV